MSAAPTHPFKEKLEQAYNNSFVNGQLNFSELRRQLHTLAKQYPYPDAAEQFIKSETRTLVAADHGCTIPNRAEFARHLNDPSWSMENNDKVKCTHSR